MKGSPNRSHSKQYLVTDPMWPMDSGNCGKIISIFWSTHWIETASSRVLEDADYNVKCIVRVGELDHWFAVNYDRYPLELTEPKMVEIVSKTCLAKSVFFVHLIWGMFIVLTAT
uniref:Uncharacterized protein n=1 Tax=Romanomermis culicivorax TaxID=13658 RepID=A0A915IDN2_ROMCU